MKTDRLDELLQCLLDGTLDDASREELDAQLLDSPEARERYRRTSAVHAALMRHASSELPSFADPHPEPRKIIRFPWRTLAAVAAVAMLIAVVDWIAVEQIRPKAEVLKVGQATWPDGARELTTGRLRANEPVELLAGRIELGYPSGARVVLEGPCRFNLESKEALTVLHGRASVHAPEGAEGFRIDTPGGNFIDRGTEFGVAVGSDGTNPVVLTEVFKGEIDVLTGQESELRLKGGESRGLVRDGAMIESLDESPIRLANSLHSQPSVSESDTANLALGKPVMSPGYCTRPHGSVFPPDNLTDGRLDDSGVPGDWSFWLAPDGESGEFTVDLIDTTSISRVSLQNTTNRSIDDRGIGRFEILGSLDNKHFEPLVEGTLPRTDPSLYGESLPFHDFTFPISELRYVKVVVLSHYRHPKRAANHPCQGGGLNEIRIFAE
ncbi:hypothetical protein HAHE_32070 [Haloferula helveola]|uniref:F5/8 type C domain-containing protein n=1 Tax=Haloferula helveola TaxID=490095 RepID=A0ABM7RIL0_9BACT|nr:hypothetical protein HAHE_32070 [Haloferula helveola]